ncbi:MULTISPECIES: DNA replication/repair protein RecF [Aeromicrobium]|uniref:DNA replication/repair protein RecF n=1 Tax=Aeromicrobium TaxID=2040 RepID=UPI0006F8D7D8|nr:MULTISPECIES: DNA replication/repair protein RecF [Aeromicrobium]KQX74149.1 recombinase RecF [Aeromicrobium sp. Root472D3]MBD8608376.1 DNA replication/repair protein RecF [Aeromicrobium sp. CFBP 8757]MCL8249917.1 DNA replication/repair protein RecF [Aeromicrobium fastidiosum]
MHVSKLILHDFRSYSDVEIELERGATAFIGSNGQGKTNLVEAIDYLSRLDSHRVSNDAPLVRAGTDQAIVRADVVKGDRTALLELEITPGRANRARINRGALPRTRDLVGVLRTVIFSPEDLALVKGDPSDRRRFLDSLLVLRTPRLAGVKADYDRVLKQRNTLLKSARGRRNVEIATLDIWDENLARTGAELVAARLTLLDALAPHLIDAYERVAAASAPDRRIVLATYRSSVVLDPELRDQATIERLILDEIERRRRDEVDRGISLVGPHRDDVVLTIGDLPAKGYASHGESWSFALALKLASFELLRADDDDPVLILDDVFAELDQGRREQLAGLVADAEQVLVTAAVADDVPDALKGHRFRVAGGEVVRD